MCEAIAEAQEVGKWISVKERMPEEFKMVLVAVRGYGPTFGYYRLPRKKHLSVVKGGLWVTPFLTYTEDKNMITHWMPIPPIPQRGT